jgi:hypothetical protein
MRPLTKFAIAIIAWSVFPPADAHAQGGDNRAKPSPARQLPCGMATAQSGAEGPNVRIAGVAAREMDVTCRPNQPCPAVDAIDARDRVVRLLGGPRETLSEGHIVVRSATVAPFKRFFG